MEENHFGGQDSHMVVAAVKLKKQQKKINNEVVEGLNRYRGSLSIVQFNHTAFVTVSPTGENSLTSNNFLIKKLM